MTSATNDVPIQASRGKSGSRFLPVILIGVLLLGAGGYGLATVAFEGSAGQSKADEKQDSESIEVRVLPVNVQKIYFVDSIQQNRSYTGTVRARRRSDLAFELSGKVNQILVDEGAKVSEGQVIAVLDTATLAAQQSAVEAQLAQARAVLKELNAGPRQEKIEAAKADVAGAQSDYESAAMRLERREVLVTKNAIPVEEYDQAKFDVRSTKARLESARARLAELVAGTREEKVVAQNATIRQLEASAEELAVAIKKSSLRAPFAATIARRYVDPGSIVGPSVPVCKLVEQNKLEAWVGLPVDVASKISVGSKHTVQIGKQSIDAKAAAKINELEAMTRTQMIVFDLESAADQGIVSGQLCQIEITTSVETSGFWVPNVALAKGVRGLSSVMTLEQDPDNPKQYRTSQRDVEIIKTDADRVLVRGSLDSGDWIVANGLHRITDGQRVSIAK